MTVDTNNRQLHNDEIAAIAKKASGDKAEQERLTKAACYTVKCWEQYPAGSPERNANYVSVGDAITLTSEIAWVKSQQVQGMFEYTLPQQALDNFRRNDVPVIQNAAKAVGGALMVDTGLTICVSVFGCSIGLPMASFGESNMIEAVSGLRNRYDGNGNTGFNPIKAGFNQISPKWGDTAYDTLNLVATVTSMRAQVPLKLGPTDGINRAESIFGATVPRINNATLSPFSGSPLPYGTTQSILLFGAGSDVVKVVNDIKVTGGN